LAGTSTKSWIACLASTAAALADHARYERERPEPEQARRRATPAAGRMPICVLPAKLSKAVLLGRRAARGLPVVLREHHKSG
jgi:hypothetical protein